ncbi:MAG: flagellin-like protein [Sphingomonadales bacterium]|jgi:flagellar hook-associated protein 3 FlgL|nr:flagellin-like protein [Sphingomonadales bacterium]MBK6492844.1 flagellin-like protein [Sphingomonadales bacterium]MBK6720285.1 flagellin-like protein [Sphingomonadales bacterium]MBL0002114.1 flagellin-like protein [Sphingomonadales bacterium]
MINAVGSRMMIEINRQKSLARTISDTQVTISTGKKIQRASDNPVAAARVAVIGRAQANSNAWAINLDTGLSLNSQADTAVTGMADRIALARELVLGGANGTLAQTDRNMIAAQLDGIADELDGLVNRKSANGQPLFATGTALSVRYDENTVFAPVPSQAQVFDAGGISLSQMVRDAATALRSGSAPAIGASITTLDTGVTKTADALGDIGQRGRRLQSLQEAARAHDIDLAAERTNLEATDISEAVAQLTAQTLTLEAAQAAFARINRRTLLDLLS